MLRLAIVLKYFRVRKHILSRIKCNKSFSISVILETLSQPFNSEINRGLDKLHCTLKLCDGENRYLYDDYQYSN